MRGLQLSHLLPITPSMYRLVLLLLTSGRDPGIIPRHTHPPEPEEVFDSSTCPGDWGGETPRLSLPRTKDVSANGVSVRTNGVSWRNLAMTPNSILLSRCTENWLSMHAAPLVSARHELLPPALKAVHAVQSRMFTSLSPSRAQIYEEVDQQTVNVQDSDEGSGSELEESEWEDDEDAEGEELDDLEDVEEPTESGEQRKPKGRVASYSMRIEAPIDEIYALLHSRGFITPKQKRPTPNDAVLSQEDYRIVAWYRRVSTGLLNYYSCCDNFLKVKSIVNYQLRWSAIHTLSKKHKSSSQQVIQKYGKNLEVTRGGKTLASFLSVPEIKKHQRGFLEIDPVPPETLIDVLYTRMKRRSREEKKHK